MGVDCLDTGKKADVPRKSRGGGFQGGVRRHNFSGGPKTHGQSDRHRAPGSIGSGTTPGRVYKGTRMAGHMADVRATVRNHEVVARNDERRVIFAAGPVPGPVGALLRLRKTTNASP